MLGDRGGVNESRPQSREGHLARRKRMTRADALVDNALVAIRLPADFFSSFVITRWTDLVGPDVARHATPVSIRGGTLWLRPTSREARLALVPLADAIRVAVGRATGSSRITNVRFTEDYGP